MEKKPFILRPIHVSVWEKLDEFRKVSGFSPSYQQMCIHCGLSKTTLSKVYQDLESIGAITRQKGRERSVESVKHPKEIIQSI